MRERLVRMALDHCDAALDALRAAPHPQGVAMLQLWLDWLWRDGARLLLPTHD